MSQIETQDPKSELYELWLNDPPLLARQCLPHWFPTPMPWVHRGIIAIMLRQTDFLCHFGEEWWDGNRFEWTHDQLEILVREFTTPVNKDDPEGEQREIFTIHYDMEGKPLSVDLDIGQHTAIILPRGFSKTTLVNFCNLCEVLYELVPFLVYVSKSERNAADQLTTLLSEMRTNQPLIEVFGAQVPRKQDVQKTTSTDMELYSGCYLTVRGAGAQIRGLVKGAVRPHHIVVDDIETIKTIDSEDETTKLVKWFLNDVMYALPRKRGVGRITLIGTILGPKAMLLQIATDRRFTVIKFGARISDGSPLWAEAMTGDEIDLALEDAARLGQRYEAGMELLSEVNEGVKQAKFPQKFNYQIMQRAQFDAVSVCLDPAISKKKKSDPTAVAAVGITPAGRYHVMDFYSQVGMNPREQVEKFFEFHFRHRATKHGLEAVAYQAALKFLIEEDMARYAQQFGGDAFFEIDALFPGNDQRKVTRIEGVLSKRYLSGYITHEHTFADLEGMFRQWPNGKKDGPDVIAMCIATLSPHQMNALDDGGAEKLLGSSLAPLEDDYFQMPPGC